MAVALEIYEALRSVGVEDTKAKSTAEAFDRVIENRMSHELARLVTKDELDAALARLETRIIKWNVATIIAVAGLTLAIVKLVG